MSKTILYDSFDSSFDLNYEPLNEYASGNTKKVVDGEFILARVEGQMFAPDGDSLNGRHYTRRLWELAIKRNTDRLNTGAVLGTLGHDVEISDKTMGEGKISHKVVRMWIDEKTGAGMGEIHILGTDSGRALNALLRGGVQLAVSTRATGELSSRKSKSGLPIIDEDSYTFQGIDFVSKGGIPSARPVVVEHHDLNTDNVVLHQDTNLIEPNSPIQETIMSTQFLESLAVEKAQLSKDLAEALNTNKTILSERDALRLEKDARQAEVSRLVEGLGEKQTTINDLQDRLANAQNANKQFEGIDAKKLSEDLVAANALVESYTTQFGSIEKLTEAFAKASEMVAQYKPLGSPTSITSMIEEMEAYAAFGSADEIDERLKTLDSYEEKATLEEVDSALEMIKQYEVLGSPEDIESAFSYTDRAVANIKDRENKSEAIEIAKRFKMKADKVEEMLIKNGKEYTVNFLEDLFKEPEIANRYSVSQRPTTPTNEAVEHTAPRVEKSRADLLLERFSKVTPTIKNPMNSYE